MKKEEEFAWQKHYDQFCKKVDERDLHPLDAVQLKERKLEELTQGSLGDMAKARRKFVFKLIVLLFILIVCGEVYLHARQ